MEVFALCLFSSLCWYVFGARAALSVFIFLFDGRYCLSGFSSFLGQPRALNAGIERFPTEEKTPNSSLKFWYNTQQPSRWASLKVDNGMIVTHLVCKMWNSCASNAWLARNLPLRCIQKARRKNVEPKCRTSFHPHASAPASERKPEIDNCCFRIENAVVQVNFS